MKIRETHKIIKYCNYNILRCRIVPLRLVGPAVLPFHLAFDLVWLGTARVKEVQRGEHIHGQLACLPGRNPLVLATSENALLLAPQAKILRSLSPDNVDF